MFHSPIRSEGSLTGRLLRRAMLTGALAISIAGTAAAQGRGAPDSFADLAERLLPAVVNISTTQNPQQSNNNQPNQPPNRREREQGPQAPQVPPGSPFEEFFKDFFDRQQRGGNRAPRPVMSLGSGFIIDPSGIVITNNHVIADADEVKVILQDDTEMTAKVLGRDPKTDVAVLKVEPKAPLPFVRWGNSDKSRVGDWVLAIGNPFGLGGSVTAGILSARGRNIRSGPYDDFFQTDAPINKGNSGGPLFNMGGEVIGINTAIFSQSGGSIGIGFSNPSNLVRSVVAQIVEFGRTKRGWLGVRIQTVDEQIAESLGLDKARGALVAGVTDGGPAEKAKIEPGDVVVSFDGKPVNNMSALPRIVAETAIGKSVPVEVWRKGKLVKLQVSVGELDESEGQQVASAPEPKQTPAPTRNERSLDTLGLKVAPITPDLRKRFNLKDDAKGVVVTDVNDSSPAGKVDLRPGDIIVQVGSDSVTTAEDVLARVKESQDAKKRSVLFGIERGGDLEFKAVPFRG
jgi:serine protease Do